MAVKARFEGKCPKCGRVYYSNREGDIIICDCYLYCPICGAEMQPYTPDLAPKTYAKDGKHDLEIIMICNNCSPPFYSSQKPVEVNVE